MPIITIDKNNISTEHVCCAIGNDKENTKRANSKKEWLKKRFEEGLVFKRLDDRGKMFIEYMPIEKVWKPIIGKNITVINCLWVSGKFKGHGYSKELLEECITDSKKLNKDGIAVITSTKTTAFLTDKKFFEHFGFKCVDKAFPYFELLLLPLNDVTNIPQFTETAKLGTIDNKEGFVFTFSNQCPFTEEYGNLLNEKIKSMGHKSQIIKINSCEEAKSFGSPFGTYGLFYNGKFVSHELMPEAKFEKFIKSLLEN